MNPVLLTTPGPAVSLDEIKRHLRVTHDDEDALIKMYAEAAADRVEAETSQKFIQRQYEWEMECFPAEIEIGEYPFQQIDSIQYWDTTNTLQTITLGDLYVDVELTATVSLPDGWPDTYDRKDAVKVTYTVGYGPEPSDVPEKARLCILLYVAHFYQNRSAVESGSTYVVPEAAKSLMRSLSVGRYVGQ